MKVTGTQRLYNASPPAPLRKAGTLRAMFTVGASPPKPEKTAEEKALMVALVSRRVLKKQATESRMDGGALPGRRTKSHPGQAVPDDEPAAISAARSRTMNSLIKESSSESIDE